MAEQGFESKLSKVESLFLLRSPSLPEITLRKRVWFAGHSWLSLNLTHALMTESKTGPLMLDKKWFLCGAIQSSNPYCYDSEGPNLTLRWSWASDNFRYLKYLLIAANACNLKGGSVVRRVRALALESNRTGFKSQACHLPALCATWVIQLAFLRLNCSFAK